MENFNDRSRWDRASLHVVVQVHDAVGKHDGVRFGPNSRLNDDSHAETFLDVTMQQSARSQHIGLLADKREVAHVDARLAGLAGIFAGGLTTKPS